MTKQTAINIRLGIFVTVGVALFITAIYFISAKAQLFNKTFRISGIFSDVSGLQAGNNVRFSGITVGIVESTTIESDSTVRVVMRIDEDVRRFIRKDAEASIGSEGLMGNKLLVLTSGSGSRPMIEPDDTIATKRPLDLDKTLNTLKVTSDNVERITGDLADIVSTIRQGKGTIGQLFMDSTYLKQTRDNLAAITGDFAVISTTLRTGKSGLGRILMDSAYVTIPVENAIRITRDLSEITGSVRLGQGVLGRLLMDSSSAFAVDTALINLKRSSVHMERVTEKAKTSFLLWGF